MTSLGFYVFFRNIFLKNFSKFKMAAIFRSKVTENGVLRFCFHPLQTKVSCNFLITAKINEKWIKLNKRKCILCNSCFVLDYLFFCDFRFYVHLFYMKQTFSFNTFFISFFFGYCFVLCLI